VRPWLLRESPGFAIVPDLAPRASEPAFDNITMSAFEGTPLAIVLCDCGLRAIAIVGAAMEVRIAPTVRHAADLGFIRLPAGSPASVRRKRALHHEGGVSRTGRAPSVSSRSDPLLGHLRRKQ
jgi:nicotinamidase-related amidase